MCAMIIGSVVDPAGVGLDNATVILGDMTALCSQDGSFRIDGVPDGRHDLKIVHRDYPVIRDVLDIDGDSAFSLMLTNPRAVVSTGSGILEAKRRAEHWLIGSYDQAVGVGISRDRSTILVYARADDGEIPVLPGLPETIDGFPVRVTPMTPPPVAPLEHTQATQSRFRPVLGGVSAAHYTTPAGTLGAVLYERKTGTPVLLSNNHTFARCSSDAEERARVGDPILQPSGMDGGTPDDAVAELSRWIPYRVGLPNLVDVALAKPLPGTGIDTRVLRVDGREEIRGTRSVTAPVHVHRCGRTTGCVSGEVVDWDFTTIMDYPTGESILYVDQLLVDMPSDEGDSGSLIIDDEGYVVGLLSGTTVIDGVTYTVANKIRNVLEILDVSLPGEEMRKRDNLFGLVCAFVLTGAYLLISTRSSRRR